MSLTERLISRVWPSYALVGACAVLSFFFYLGAIPLTSPNEGLYAEAAREMLETGDPVIARANGVVYLEKPPLLYWLAALSMTFLGESALAARLPSAAAALATACVLVAAGRRLGPRSAGALSGVVFATSMGLVIVARQVLFDSLLTLWTTLALAAFWFGTEPGRGDLRKKGLLAVGYAALALGILTKGLVGLALPALTVAFYVLLARDFARLRAAWSPAGLALFLAIAIPWHVAGALRQRQFAWFYFVNEHWLRFLGRRQPPDFHQDPIFSPALSLLLLTLPWGVFLPAAVRSEIASRGQRKVPAETLFLVCWALAPALFFTLSRTRTYYYQLPSVPPLALLVGRLWARLVWSGGPWGPPNRLGWGGGPCGPPNPLARPRGPARERWLLGPAVALGLLVLAVWIFAGFGSWGSLRNAAWHALGFACGGWLVAGLAVAAALIAARREAAAFGVLAVSVLFTVIAAVAFASASSRPVFRSEEPAARIITGFGPPPWTLVAVEGKFENHSSLAFYLPRRLRPLLVVDALDQGDLAFGSRLEDTRQIFVSTPTMFELAGTRPLFYLTLSPSKLRVPPKLKLVACDDDVMLWTNVGTDSRANESLERGSAAAAFPPGG